MPRLLELTDARARKLLVQGYSLDGIWLSTKDQIARVDNREQAEPVIRCEARNMGGVMFSETAFSRTHIPLLEAAEFALYSLSIRALKIILGSPPRRPTEQHVYRVLTPQELAARAVETGQCLAPEMPFIIATSVERTDRGPVVAFSKAGQPIRFMRSMPGKCEAQCSPQWDPSAGSGELL